MGGDLSRRDVLLILTALAFIALAGLYWYYPYRDKQTAITAMSERVERLEILNQRAQADLAKGGAPELKAEADQYGEMFEVLRQLVPGENEVPTLLAQVSNASRREGLELGGIKPLPIIEGPDFDTHRFQIGVVGGYHAIARFLTNVGSLTRVVTAVDVKMFDRESKGNSPIPRRGNNAMVQADFEIRTYVARSTPMASQMTAEVPK